MIIASLISCTTGHPKERSTTIHDRDSVASTYRLPRTEIRSLHSNVVGIDYELYASVPRGFSGATVYPALVLLDADYSFGLTRNIVEHFVDRGDLPEVVIVGIAYPGADESVSTYRLNRTRDYTPTMTMRGGYGAEFQKYSGGAKDFARFIVDEMLPVIQQEYQVHPEDLTLVGHSYGGLFGMYMMLTRPDVFRRYILVSPSLWYDDKVIFEFEQRLSASHMALHARVFLGVGAHENQPHVGRAMVDDLLELEATLRSRNSAGLQITSHVFPDETHNSVFPAAVTRGLRIVFSGGGE